eukprot:12440_6
MCQHTHTYEVAYATLTGEEPRGASVIALGLGLLFLGNRFCNGFPQRALYCLGIRLRIHAECLPSVVVPFQNLGLVFSQMLVLDLFNFPFCSRHARPPAARRCWRSSTSTKVPMQMTPRNRLWQPCSTLCSASILPTINASACSTTTIS